MTVRTIEYQGTLVQGTLCQMDQVYCSCSNGYIDIDRCDCEAGWCNGCATVEVNGKKYTGKLVKSFRRKQE